MSLYTQNAHTHERARYLWYDPNHGLYRKDDEHRGSDDRAALGVSRLRHKLLWPGSSVIVTPAHSGSTLNSTSDLCETGAAGKIHHVTMYTMSCRKHKPGIRPSPAGAVTNKATVGKCWCVFEPAWHFVTNSCGAVFVAEQISCPDGLQSSRERNIWIGRSDLCCRFSNSPTCWWKPVMLLDFRLVGFKRMATAS